MTSGKSFIIPLFLLVIVTFSSMSLSLASRHLLQTTLPNPTTLPPLPSNPMPQGNVPPLPTIPTMPNLPSLPTIMPTLNLPPFAASLPNMPTMPNLPFPFFSSPPSTSNP
ncbi:pre-mRNA polyadenylation factor FIP1-like [Vigna radiata var. radiata]|uniref:Pre-mRNA polyadenylation factor FIP1-like n=1 Tax=Vigna radiata var. radiata TaxID=3916 RepID=A0A3Q0F380_VIGRR|nr:pre-mRNA polyadenylation factor FIP1-like [Vigna radiata var. radiata]